MTSLNETDPEMPSMKTFAPNKSCLAVSILRWMSWMECCLATVGFASAFVLGSCVPAAIYIVGEVVTLFITNRRARLDALLQEGKEHLKDHSKKTDLFMQDLAKELEDSINFSNDHNLSIIFENQYNHTLKDDIQLNYLFNVVFESELYDLCFWMLVVSLCQLVSGFCTNFSFNFAAERFCSRMRHLVRSVTLIQDQGDDIFAQNNGKVHEDLRLVQEGFSGKFGLLVSGSVTLIGCLGLSFYRTWQLPLILTPILLFNFFGNKALTQLLTKTSKKLKVGISIVISHLQQTVNAVDTVLSLHQEKTEVHRCDILFQKIEKYIHKIGLIEGWGSGLIGMATLLLNAGMLWYGVRLVVEDLRTGTYPFRPGSIVVVFFCFLRGLATFNQGWTHWSSVEKATKATTRVNEILQSFIWQDVGCDLVVNVKSKASTLINHNALLTDKTAVQRLAFHRQCTYNQVGITKSFPTGRSKLLKMLLPLWPFIILACVGSTILGSAIPVTFYVFCEVIGAMANLEEEMIFHRTTNMLGAFSIVAIAILLGTFFQKYSLDVICFRFSSKIQSSMLESYFRKERAQDGGSIVLRNEFEHLRTKHLPVVEVAVRNFFGVGFQITMALMIAVPLACSVVWNQALILATTIPLLITIYILQYTFLQSMQKTNPLKPSTRLKVLSSYLVQGIFCGILQAFRETAFATILFFGGFVIIHHGVNNKNVLQVNLILINTILQISQLMNSLINVKLGWKASKQLSRYLANSESSGGI